MGGEVLADLRMGVVWIPVVEQAEEGAADQREIGEQSWFRAAGVVLLPKGVPSPVVSILDTGPVVSRQGDPACVGAFAGVLAGEIVAGFEGFVSGTFDGPPAPDGHDGAGKREADGDRFDRPEDQTALVEASVPEFVLDKRGSRPSQRARACLSRLGWLPLICARYSPPFSTMARASSR